MPVCASTPTESEVAWLAWSRGRRIAQLEPAVATRRPGDTPVDRPDPKLRKHVLRFEVSPETLALFRDLQSAVRADIGTHADDDTLLHEIAPPRPGRPHRRRPRQLSARRHPL